MLHLNTFCFPVLMPAVHYCVIHVRPSPEPPLTASPALPCSAAAPPPSLLSPSDCCHTVPAAPAAPSSDHHTGGQRGQMFSLFLTVTDLSRPILVYFIKINSPNIKKKEFIPIALTYIRPCLIHIFISRWISTNASYLSLNL